MSEQQFRIGKDNCGNDVICENGATLNLGCKANLEMICHALNAAESSNARVVELEKIVEAAGELEGRVRDWLNGHGGGIDDSHLWELRDLLSNRAKHTGEGNER